MIGYSVLLVMTANVQILCCQQIVIFCVTQLIKW